MGPEKVRELIERIQSASMQELFDILRELDLTNCPGEVVAAWHFRHQEIWAEIDRKQIEMMRQYIAENQHRAVQVDEDIWKIPLRSDRYGKGNL